MARVLVAPTAFKGTIGPRAAALAMAEGVRGVWPAAAVVQRPLSDGGNGLLEACHALGGGVWIERVVTGPLGESVQARALRQDGVVVVESAEACGLHLVAPARRDPLVASTRGVGELIAAAASAGEQIVLGLGGSGTVDGGTGMARALGWRFLDASGVVLSEGGGPLQRLARIEPPLRRPELTVTALCDVDNPLTGPQGAARVYGPQKGARGVDIERLEAGLARLAEVIESDLGLSVVELAGAGAAGGLGAGARAFLEAKLVGGAAWMMERARFSAEVSRADLVVTGEGAFDAQSGMGKVTGKVIKAARGVNVPVLLVCGRVEGRIPAGVEALAGGERILTEDDLTELVAAGCRALAGGDRL